MPANKLKKPFSFELLSKKFPVDQNNPELLSLRPPLYDGDSFDIKKTGKSQRRDARSLRIKDIWTSNGWESLYRGPDILNIAKFMPEPHEVTEAVHGIYFEMFNQKGVRSALIQKGICQLAVVPKSKYKHRKVSPEYKVLIQDQRERDILAAGDAMDNGDNSKMSMSFDVRTFDLFNVCWWIHSGHRRNVSHGITPRIYTTFCFNARTATLHHFDRIDDINTANALDGGHHIQWAEWKGLCAL